VHLPTPTKNKQKPNHDLTIPDVDSSSKSTHLMNEIVRFLDILWRSSVDEETEVGRK
jgi:hypothetical protein